MARPTNLNEETIKQFAADVEEGLPICYCCDSLGITKMSYSNWIKQGEYDFENSVDSIYGTFFYSIKKAYASYVRSAKKRIRKGENGWQGEAWWLERTNSMFVLSKEDTQQNETVVINPNLARNKS